MDANKKSQSRQLPKKLLNPPPVVINPILLQQPNVINNTSLLPLLRNTSKSKTNLEYAQKHSILFKNKLTLSFDNIYDCPSQNLFQYEQFPQYNGMVLEKDGFNSDNTVRY